jgi:hypothetical protein
MDRRPLRETMALVLGEQKVASLNLLKDAEARQAEANLKRAESYCAQCARSLAAATAAGIVQRNDSDWNNTKSDENENGLFSQFFIFPYYALQNTSFSC